MQKEIGSDGGVDFQKKHFMEGGERLYSKQKMFSLACLIRSRSCSLLREGNESLPLLCLKSP